MIGEFKDIIKYLAISEWHWSIGGGLYQLAIFTIQLILMFNFLKKYI